jgi:ribosomal-protein-alanine N-acetyltransferase
MFLTEIRMDNISYFYVATLMDVIVGYGGFWLVSDEVHLVNLCVDKPYRRCGIATTLLRFLLSRGAEKGARYSTLEVRSSNTPAINLYRSFGFREVAIRKGYYTDTGEDAIVMLLDNLGKKRY